MHSGRSTETAMKKQTRIAVGVATLSAAFWILPLYRVVSYLLSLPTFTSGLSIDEANDIIYGRSLLFSYAVCVLCPMLLGFLYGRRPRIMVLAPCLLMIAMAMRVIALRPEEVIVLFPSINPFQPAQIGLLAGLIGIVFYRYSASHADFDPA